MASEEETRGQFAEAVRRNPSAVITTTTTLRQGQNPPFEGGRRIAQILHLNSDLREVKNNIGALFDHCNPNTRNPERGVEQKDKALVIPLLVKSFFLDLPKLPGHLLDRLGHSIDTYLLARQFSDQRTGRLNLSTVEGVLNGLEKVYGLMSADNITSDMLTSALCGGMPELRLDITPLERVVASAIPAISTALVVTNTPGDITPEVATAGLTLVYQALLSRGKIRSGVDPMNPINMAVLPALALREGKRNEVVRQILDYHGHSSASPMTREGGEISPSEAYLISAVIANPLVGLTLYAQYNPLDPTYLFILNNLEKRHLEIYRKLINISIATLPFITADVGVLNDKATKDIIKVLNELPISQMIYLMNKEKELIKPLVFNKFDDCFNKKINLKQDEGSIIDKVRKAKETYDQAKSDASNSMDYQRMVRLVAPLLVALSFEGVSDEEVKNISILGCDSALSTYIIGTWSAMKSTVTQDEMEKIFDILEQFWKKTKTYKQGGPLPKIVMDACDGGKSPKALQFAYKHMANSTSKLLSAVRPDSTELTMDVINKFVAQSQIFIKKRGSMLSNNMTEIEAKGIIKWIDSLYIAWTTLKPTVNWDAININELSNTSNNKPKPAAILRSNIVTLASLISNELGPKLPQEILEANYPVLQQEMITLLSIIPKNTKQEGVIINT